jgi:hypothetical protein
VKTKTGTLLDLISDGLRVASDYEIRKYDHERHEQLAKARRARRAEILDREGVPLSPIGRATVVHEMQPHPEACSTILRWTTTQGAPPFLACVGERGHGKTVAGAWWVADRDGRYVKARELARLYRAQFGDDHARWRGYLGARCLVIDEVGTEDERERDVVRAMLEEVVDERQSRRTLLLGNITARQFAERLTARAADRWAECGFTLELKAGRSMRRRAA